ncbi:uncharacterized protein V1513DRAFT_455732 [Lipomyces chichibuensis]|uniref:uncharacterized protein n=1 Tax=Lipomyces chichibuensis TaxID=1546026 RepID=UPI0033436790
MPGNRSLLRNVHFFDGSKPDDPPLGGLYLNPSVTKTKFHRKRTASSRENGD